jgi:DNA polymerase III alpha subunit
LLSVLYTISMKIDAYGQIILSESDIINQLMVNSDSKLKKCLMDFVPNISKELNIDNIPELIRYHSEQLSESEFDERCQSNWHMPEEYKNLDIAEWLLNQCTTDVERDRVGKELLLYLDRNAFPLLQYLKYLVDVMRKNNIVWGVGRGSSVASYVLYLIGIHRINSIYFDLAISDFLK